MIKWLYIKIFQISMRQEERRVNAFRMSADPPALPVTGLLRCGLRPQN